MRAQVRKVGSAPERYTDERCFIRELWNSESDADVSVAVARVSPGVCTAWHRLRDTVERYLIIAGQGRVELGDDLVCQVQPGDVVSIPAGVAQRIENTGTTDLRFHCVCTPRFTQACYERLADDRVKPSSSGSREAPGEGGAHTNVDPDI